MIPNSAVLNVTCKSIPIQLQGQDLFDLGQTRVEFEYKEACTGEMELMFAKACIVIEQVELTKDQTILCRIPEFSTWEYTDPSVPVDVHVERTSEGEEDEKEAEGLIKPIVEWWKGKKKLSISVRVSLNGGISYLPNQSENFYLFEYEQLEGTVPSSGPLEGGTNVCLSSPCLSFCTEDVMVKLKCGDVERVVSGKCVVVSDMETEPLSYGIQYISPEFPLEVLNPSKDPTQEATEEEKEQIMNEEDSQKPTLSSIVSEVSIALNGIDYSKHKTTFEYYGE